MFWVRDKIVDLPLISPDLGLSSRVDIVVIFWEDSRVKLPFRLNIEVEVRLDVGMAGLSSVRLEELCCICEVSKVDELLKDRENGEGVSSWVVDPAVVVLSESSDFMIIILEVRKGGLEEIWVVGDCIVDACFVDKEGLWVEEVSVNYSLPAWWKMENSDIHLQILHQ